jgi:hypothetical protein
MMSTTKFAVFLTLLLAIIVSFRTPRVRSAEEQVYSEQARFGFEKGGRCYAP